MPPGCHLQTAIQSNYSVYANYFLRLELIFLSASGVLLWPLREAGSESGHAGAARSAPRFGTLEQLLLKPRKRRASCWNILQSLADLS
jgi:hypothetical protein